MELNKNSTTARLYRWFYNIKEMPQNLCPYFWKLALMWILVIPFSIFTLPTLLFSDLKDNHPIKRFSASFIIYGIIYIAFGLILAPIIWIFYAETPLNSAMLGATVVGTIIWFVLAILGFLKLAEYLLEKISDAVHYRRYKNYKKKHLKQADEPSVIIEFVKARYNKYCPKIDWK